MWMSPFCFSHWKKRSQILALGPNRKPWDIFNGEKLQGDNAYDAESHGKQRARKAETSKSQIRWVLFFWVCKETTHNSTPSIAKPQGFWWCFCSKLLIDSLHLFGGKNIQIWQKTSICSIWYTAGEKQRIHVFPQMIFSSNRCRPRAFASSVFHRCSTSSWSALCLTSRRWTCPELGGLGNYGKL